MLKINLMKKSTVILAFIFISFLSCKDSEKKNEKTLELSTVGKTEVKKTLCEKRKIRPQCINEYCFC